MEKSNFSISIRSSTIFRILGAIIVVLLLMSILGLVSRFVLGHDVVFGLVAQFDFDKETNIPTYFSSFILLISAALLGIIALFKKKEHDSYASHWLILSMIFLFLSMDETVGIHELLIDPLKSAFNLSGIFYYSWVIVGFIFILFFAIFYFKFFFNLPARTRLQFFIAAILYLGGVLGVELIGGYYRDTYQQNLAYYITVQFEEVLEMTGILIFINALLKYIAENISDVFLSFKED